LNLGLVLVLFALGGGRSSLGRKGRRASSCWPRRRDRGPKFRYARYRP